jgi:hypothetical protein
MSSFKFVGNQERIKIPEGSQIVEISTLIPFTRIDIDPFDLLGQKELISSWLYPVKSARLNQGGKILFSRETGEEIEAVCISFIVGRELSLVSDDFGTASFNIEKKKSDVAIRAEFKILTTLYDEKRELFHRFISQLSEICR